MAINSYVKGEGGIVTRESLKEMKTTEILDMIYPYTKDDERCMADKRKKTFARVDLALKIEYYKEGRIVDLPDEVIKMLNED